jgi:hypothetical protein
VVLGGALARILKSHPNLAQVLWLWLAGWRELRPGLTWGTAHALIDQMCPRLPSPPTTHLPSLIIVPTSATQNPGKTQVVDDLPSARENFREQHHAHQHQHPKSKHGPQWDPTTDTTQLQPMNSDYFVTTLTLRPSPEPSLPPPSLPFLWISKRIHSRGDDYHTYSSLDSDSARPIPSPAQTTTK